MKQQPWADRTSSGVSAMRATNQSVRHSVRSRRRDGIDEALQFRGGLIQRCDDEREFPAHSRVLIAPSAWWYKLRRPCMHRPRHKDRFARLTKSDSCRRALELVPKQHHVDRILHVVVLDAFHCVQHGPTRKIHGSSYACSNWCDETSSVCAKNPLQFGAQRRNLRLNDVPDDIEVHAKIVVNEPVSHPRH